MSNYPDNTGHSDPDAPWNQPDAEIRSYAVKMEVMVYLDALSADEAKEAAIAAADQVVGYRYEMEPRHVLDIEERE